MNQEKKISTAKAIAAILLAVVILAAAQSIAILIGGLPSMLGAPDAIGNLIIGILYPLLAFLGVKVLCAKLLKLPLAECKLPRFSLKPVWCAAAVLMPCIVSGILLLMPGHWESGAADMAQTFSVLSGAVFFYCIGVGIVEEMIFRGVIMSVLECRWNPLVAVVFPSVLFGLLHIAGNEMGFLSILQLIAAGSLVGVLFSLVTYESGNIWNSALMHGVWNMIIIGKIVHIGDAADEFSLFSYVLESDSFFITGGDFGIEASVVSVAAYAVFAVLAWVCIRKRGQKSH